MCLSVAPWSALLFFVCFGGRIKEEEFSLRLQLYKTLNLNWNSIVSLCVWFNPERLRARDDDDDDAPRRVKFGR